MSQNRPEIIIPENFLNQQVGAFFTGKGVNIEEDEIAKITGHNKRLYMPIQKHTNEIVVLRDPSANRVVSDAVVTSITDVVIGVQVADCVPILLYSPGPKVIGAVHAGWRGSSSGILKNTIEAFYREFSVPAKDIIIAIGPSIKGCCYEVGEEVVEAVLNINGDDGCFCTKKINHKWHIDLGEVNRKQAMDMYVPADNIWVSKDCTYHMPERYHSYRRLKGLKGRQGAFIYIF